MIFLTQQNNDIEMIIDKCLGVPIIYIDFFNSMVSNGTIWFILAGVIIIVIAIVFAVKKRKKKD